MTGIAVITEACIDRKDRSCVDVCPVQCIYELDAATSTLFSEDEAGSGDIATRHSPNTDLIAVFGDRILYVNPDECTSCGACYEPDVCPVGAIYPEERVPNGTDPNAYNASDEQRGRDHSFFVELTNGVFAG